MDINNVHDGEKKQDGLDPFEQFIENHKFINSINMDDASPEDIKAGIVYNLTMQYAMALYGGIAETRDEDKEATSHLSAMLKEMSGLEDKYDSNIIFLEIMKEVLPQVSELVYRQIEHLVKTKGGR